MTTFVNNKVSMIISEYQMIFIEEHEVKSPLLVNIEQRLVELNQKVLPDVAYSLVRVYDYFSRIFNKLKAKARRIDRKSEEFEVKEFVLLWLQQKMIALKTSNRIELLAFNRKQNSCTEESNVFEFKKAG